MKATTSTTVEYLKDMLMKLMGIPDCSEAAALSSQALDRELTIVERLRLRMHFIICDTCPRFYRQLSQMHTMFGLVGRRSDIYVDRSLRLSPEDKESIQQRILAELSSLQQLKGKSS